MEFKRGIEIKFTLYFKQLCWYDSNQIKYRKALVERYHQNSLNEFI